MHVLIRPIHTSDGARQLNRNLSRTSQFPIICLSRPAVAIDMAMWIDRLAHVSVVLLVSYVSLLVGEFVLSRTCRWVKVLVLVLILILQGLRPGRYTRHSSWLGWWCFGELLVVLVVEVLISIRPIIVKAVLSWAIWGLVHVHVHVPVLILILVLIVKALVVGGIVWKHGIHSIHPVSHVEIVRLHPIHCIHSVHVIHPGHPGHLVHVIHPHPHPHIHRHRVHHERIEIGHHRKIHALHHLRHIRGHHVLGQCTIITFVFRSVC